MPILVVLLIFSLFSNAQTKSWTIDYCVETAIHNSLLLKYAQLKQENAMALVRQSSTLLLPTINASANHSYNFGRNINPVTNTFQENNIQANQFRLDGVLPIFNGFQTYFRMRETRSNLDASQQEIKHSKNEITIQVNFAYLQVLFNRELVHVSALQIENTKTKTLQKEKSVDAGVVPPSQLVEMQALLAADELNITMAENNLELSKLALLQLMQLPAETEVILSMPESAALPTEPIENTTEIYTHALLVMPSIKKTNLLMETAKIRTRSVKTAYLPNINLYGGILSNFAQVLGQGNPYGFEHQLKNNFGQYVSLALNIPILNAWQFRTNIQSAVIESKVTELNVTEAQNALRQDIEKAYLNKKAAYKKYLALEKQTEMQKQIFTMAERRSETGTIDMIEYSTVKNNAAKAESDYIRAKYDYIFKTKILEFYKAS